MSNEGTPFFDVNLSKLSDDEIIERMSKINHMISYYHWTNYSYLVPSLQNWRDMCSNELRERAEKRRRDKLRGKESNIIFDNSDEAMETAKKKDQPDQS